MLKREDALNIDLDSLRKVHFIGITSAFDSFCAEYLLNLGKYVTASEFHQELPEAKEWRERGILYEGGHSATYITNDLDLVVFPNGPIPGNPECEETERKNIPAITVGQMLGIISKNFKVIAIAGTHGKTTTSALTVWLLYKGLGIKPNFVIGDKILNWNQSWNYNKDSEYLVVEACEYKKQFLDRAPNPYISVLTNVELDHTDYYHSQEEYNHAFSEFISNSKNCLQI
jgi:UDP-N-acetylmuramate--alanine ligase